MTGKPSVIYLLKQENIEICTENGGDHIMLPRHLTARDVIQFTILLLNPSIRPDIEELANESDYKKGNRCRN